MYHHIQVISLFWCFIDFISPQVYLISTTLSL